MTKAEILEFLELPESAGESEIRVRLDDKLAYFQLLSENAPNDFLRKLHISNTEKIKQIQAQLSKAEVTNRPAVNQSQPASSYVSPPSGNYGSPSNYVSQAYDASGTGVSSKPVQHQSAAAWLVRHTENLSAKPFPLYLGKNLIGRISHPTIPTIEIGEDPYVSRVHALLNVTSIDPLQIIVSDDGSVTGGKPSKNGTYINGDDRRLTRKMLMEENDTIQVGMTKFTIRLNNTNVNKIIQEVEESDFMKTVVIDIF